MERLGSPKGIRVNVRIIAATHRDLARRVADGTFREDLFYRLNVFPIEIPPLRERLDDIPLLVWHFIALFTKEYGKTIETVSDQTMLALQNYCWPGNVRELSNLVERAIIMASGPDLTIQLPVARVSPVAGDVLVDVEKAHIRSVLESVGWRIRGTSGAARRLGLQPTTLESRMAKLGLTRPKAS
jgi:transcriptional regulator with GAF, ATPase, and Fis domain